MAGHLVLAAVADSRRNNFRLIRHIAATAVIFVHSFMVLTPAASPVGWAWKISEPGAGIAVDVFFVASGFLVARSLLRRGDVLDYVLSRSLRIYPALVVVVWLTAFVLGPAVTSLPLAQYFATKSVYGYVFYDSLMWFPNRFRYQLPGVFTGLGSMAGDTVNASLWTLPWEVCMYASLLVLYKLRALRLPIQAAFLLSLGLLYAAEAAEWISLGVWASLAVRFAVFFYTGVALYSFRQWVPLTHALMIAATTVFAATWWLFGAAVLLPFWLGYAVLYFAYHPALVIDRWCEGPDFSYGLYIYAYPIQQTLVWAFQPTSLPLFIAVVLALTTLVAMASWYLIEAPALALKARIRSTRREGSVAAPSSSS